MSPVAGRQAWLWPEFGHFYPPLDAGKWESVGVMADKLTAWLLWQAVGICPDRVLRPEHFEFRGTSPRPAFLPGGHTRRDDTLRHNAGEFLEWGAGTEGKAEIMDKDDVVIAIAASLYASRATDDALRAEPPIEALANEAWDLYYKLGRAVRASDRRDGEPQIGRAKMRDGE